MNFDQAGTNHEYGFEVVEFGIKILELFDVVLHVLLNHRLVIRFLFNHRWFLLSRLLRREVREAVSVTFRSPLVRNHNRLVLLRIGERHFLAICSETVHIKDSEFTIENGLLFLSASGIAVAGEASRLRIWPLILSELGWCLTLGC